MGALIIWFLLLTWMGEGSHMERKAKEEELGVAYKCMGRGSEGETRTSQFCCYSICTVYCVVMYVLVRTSKCHFMLLFWAGHPLGWVLAECGRTDTSHAHVWPVGKVVGGRG